MKIFRHDQLAADVNQSTVHSSPTTYTPALVQQVVVPVASLPQPDQAPAADASDVDDLDFDAVARRLASDSEPQQPPAPSYDQPVIRGFDLDNDDDA